MPTGTARDVVVIGSSAGGVDALPRLLSKLPAQFPASVFVVQHMAPHRDAQLANILQRASKLDVAWAGQGDRFEPGKVYVAPPDVHLSLSDEHMSLHSGPRENYVRPSIDRLFRSAAVSHGGRAVGVLLTGMMEDGVAGAIAIQRAGGRVVVQDPSDAAFPELPTRALAALQPDATLPLDAIASTLVDFVRAPVPSLAPPDDVRLEAELDQQPIASFDQLDRLGPRVSSRCPECGGALWSIGKHDLPRWRCYLGHAGSAQELLARSDGELEAALWSALRALHDHASMLETLGRNARSNSSAAAEDYEARARATRRQAELARQFVIDLLKRPR